jgi:Holliday junction resolvasome RuvABC endonuclease subunit
MTYDQPCVMALYPTAYGYAFVYFATRARLVDWAYLAVQGSRKQRNAKSIADIGKLFDRYNPDIVVLEDWKVPGSRRSKRIRRLYRSIVHAALTRNIEVKQYSREDIRKTYESVGAESRYEIAQATAQEFPALAYRLPKQKKKWESERTIIELFLAAALSLTYYREASSAPE